MPFVSLVPYDTESEDSSNSSSSENEEPEQKEEQKSEPIMNKDIDENKHKKIDENKHEIINEKINKKPTIVLPPPNLNNLDTNINIAETSIHHQYSDECNCACNLCKKERYNRIHKDKSLEENYYKRIEQEKEQKEKRMSEWRMKHWGHIPKKLRHSDKPLTVLQTISSNSYKKT